MGGGGQHGKFDALDYRKIKLGDAGKLGKYDILSVLPDKFARFLYELHDFLFSSLDLPPLPSDRSDFDVHAQSITIRYESFCICSPVRTMLVIVKILIIGLIRIIGFKCNYCNGVVNNFMYISTNVKANIILSLVQR